MELGQKNTEGQKSMENLNEELQMAGLTRSFARRTVKDRGAWRTSLQKLQIVELTWNSAERTTKDREGACRTSVKNYRWLG